MSRKILLKSFYASQAAFVIGLFLLFCFRDVMVREGYKYDGLYDWVKRKRAEAAVKDGPVAGLKDATKGRSDRHRSRPSERNRDRGGDRGRDRERGGDRARGGGDRGAR